MREPRVAFFTDSYAEINGVARTSRALVDFAASRRLPMLCVHAGAATQVVHEGSITRLELARGRVSFGVESDLRFDLLFWRHRSLVADLLRDFQADLLHITGPSDVGQVGAYLAHVHDLPLVASWHTNLHDFAALRVGGLLGALPRRARAAIVDATRRHTLKLLLDFYRIPLRVLAPNPELVQLISGATGRPAELMPRGVDTELFSPGHRSSRDAVFTLGYVGRLSAEKNVRLLVEIEQALIRAGRTDYRMVIVGDGRERRYLESRLRRADFLGVLTGIPLARAYADMDLLLFPSDADTFGNVVLEALASGAPVVAMDRGGPRFIVRHGVTGFLASDARGFRDAILATMSDPARLAVMRRAARERALDTSWPRVFAGVYLAYQRCLEAHARRQEDAPTRPSAAGRLVLRGVRALAH